MIKIEYQKDLNTFKNKGINSLITAYISDYFDMLTKVNRCENLAEIGAIYLLEMGGFVLTNLISKIGADVKKLKSTKDLWNADTDKYIKETALKADKIIIAWGKFTETRKVFSQREKNVMN